MAVPTWLKSPPALAAIAGAAAGSFIPGVGTIVGGVVGGGVGFLATKFLHQKVAEGAAPPLAPDAMAYMQAKHAEAVNHPYYAGSGVVVPDQPDGSKAKPFLLMPGQMFVPAAVQGAWGIRVANGQQMLGQFSKPVTLLGQVQYQWVQSKS